MQEKIKIIFLDIDGVLNSDSMYTYITGKKSGQNKKGGPYIDTIENRIWGISDKKLKLLKRIVEATNAKIVLTSSWKQCWVAFHYPHFDDEFYEYEDDFLIGKYLCRKFLEHNLRILDTTYNTEHNPYRRGQAALDWIKKNNEKYIVDNYVFIDDEFFDYASLHLSPKTIITDPVSGLLEKHVQKAIKILNKEKGKIE